MSYEAECSKCGKSTENLLDFKCPNCGYPLTLQVNVNFEAAKIRRDTRSAWRYSRFYPYEKENMIVTLGEGWTPLVKLSQHLYLKLESQNPTGSFKDRGSTTLISALHQSIEKAHGYVSEDSSGNAGASIAAYAARAGLKARIYVPETVAGPKFNQIQVHGAEVVKVKGQRKDVTEEARKPEEGKFYVGHVLHPLFRDGIRTLAYEVAEQFAWSVPKRLYLPVSAGTLLLGVLSGFKHLADSGTIKTIPRVVACQTRQVSPLYHQFMNLDYQPPTRVTSIADALISTDPPLLELMLKSLKDADGEATVVEENEIISAFTELAQKGLFVEPSSAVAYAAYKKQLDNGEALSGDDAVVVLTGHGLKTSCAP